jgi:RNA polymerase sigma-70 factor (ECF subfamily)
VAGGGIDDGETGMVDERPVTYCLVPRDLAPKVHELLRDHFRDDPTVRVVVEQRAGERRSEIDRRAATIKRDVDRRRIRNLSGRRIDARRASTIEVDPVSLPRRARSLSGRLVFFECVEPNGEQVEDADTARLITRIQAGDSDLFASLYMRYFDRVYSYLRLALRHDEDAEDATQQVFLKVFKALPRYERRDRPFRYWLFTIVRNSAISHLEKHQRVDPVDPAVLTRRLDRQEDHDASGALEWVTDGELLMFVERLSVPQRQVLALRYMIGMSGPEIAQLLGCSETDVRNLQHRSLRFLRDRLTALGRKPSGGGIRMRRWVKPAPVLRSRRFALMR